jgi:hypothetical protein
MGVISYNLSVTEMGGEGSKASSSCGSFDLASLGSSATMADLKQQMLDMSGE